MTKEMLFPHIDHTQLKAYCSWEDIQSLCSEALEYHTASVCIPPSYVKRAKQNFPDLNICTVIGFPLGYSTTHTKIAEAADAISNGASEIDMVINIGDVKNGDFDRVAEEIRAVRQATEGYVLKVIIETCYLTDEEKCRLCRIITDARADYIKTSTGFGTAGAVLTDIRLFQNYIGSNVKIKAAGGVKSKEDIEAFLDAGCERIGTSSAVRLLTSEHPQ